MSDLVVTPIFDKIHEKMLEREKKRLELERQRRIQQEKEIENLGKRLDALLSAKTQTSSKGLDNIIEKNREYLFQSLEGISSNSNGDLDITKYVKDPEPSLKPPIPDNPADILEKFNQIYNRLSILDPDQAAIQKDMMHELDSGCSSFRRKIIYDNLKITYANALHIQAKNILRKNKIKEMSTTLSDNLKNKFNVISQALIEDNHIITDKEFTDLSKAYSDLLSIELRNKSNAVLAEQTAVQMQKLGYTPIREGHKYGPVFFNTSDPEYRIMSNVNPQNGQLSFRFVRVVASEREKQSLSSEQKRRDREMAKKWCKKSHELLSMLESATGIDLDEIYRQEPDENQDVLVVVDKELQHSQAAKAEMHQNDRR